eukprot:GHUV01033159.1.p1 GENE.GHUV01033159.1~~GHUV01033159.1.p1  ORF type:complete len:212 (+),score=65.09 GHUV01033159.1:79-714(+)
MGTSFKDLNDDDVSKDPLARLPCGHVFTTSTLDGWMEMNAAYHKMPQADDADLAVWCAPKSLPAEAWAPKKCPAGGCRGVVVGVKRYGRPANKALLDLVQRKHLQDGRLQNQRISEQLSDLASQVNIISSSSRILQQPSVCIRLLGRSRGFQDQLQVALQQQHRPPTQKVYEASLAALKRLQLEKQLSPAELAQRAEVLLVPQPDLSFCGR